jgi:hypothetical protein
MAFAFEIEGPLTRAKSRTAKGMAAIVYRMAVKLKGSI